jgi:hypothetical protein
MRLLRNVLSAPGFALLYLLAMALYARAYDGLLGNFYESTAIYETCFRTTANHLAAFLQRDVREARLDWTGRARRTTTAPPRPCSSRDAAGRHGCASAQDGSPPAGVHDTPRRDAGQCQERQQPGESRGEVGALHHPAHGAALPAHHGQPNGKIGGDGRSGLR